ncbi:MAG: glycosyltransferase family 9 protein [Chlamydiota bacterium]|jgi:ADP-heptose:LPS heptosyltransferase
MKKLLSKYKNKFFKIFVKTVSFFLKKNCINSKNLRVLILSTTGLGDSLWATPAFSILKQYFPNAYLAVLTTPFGEQVFQNNPHVNQIYTLASSWFFLWKKLKKEKFQVVFHFHTSQRFVLPLSCIIGAEKIVGTKNKCKGLDFLLTNAFDDNKTHEVVRRLEQLEALQIFTKPSTLSFYLTEKEKEQSRKFVTPNKLKVAIHPGAKDSYKCWPSSNFIKLIHLLHKNFSIDLYLTGSFHEMSALEKIASEAPFVQIVQNFDIRKFAGLLSQMNLVISNDTGPMHLAEALNIKTIGIFSPTNPNLCGPLSENSYVFYKKRTCSSCIARKCREPFCLYQIGPEEVFEKCKFLLAH